MSAADRRAVNGRTRAVLAAVATGILALSAAGTATLTDAGAPALTIFERAPTDAERAKAAELASDSLFFFQNDPEVRLLLTARGADDDEGQDVWALRVPGSVIETDGDAVCLLTTRRGTEQEFLAGCLPAELVARRGFVPLDEPRPFLFVDGEELLIEWGPTGDARLVPRPEPPQPPRLDEQGSDS